MSADPAMRFTERGFRIFEEGAWCGVRVWESSLAFEGAHCWIAQGPKASRAVFQLNVACAELLAGECERFVAGAAPSITSFKAYSAHIGLGITASGDQRLLLVAVADDQLGDGLLRLNHEDAARTGSALRVFVSAARCGLLMEPAEVDDSDEHDAHGSNEKLG